MNVFLYGLIIFIVTCEGFLPKKNGFKWRTEGWIAFLIITISIALFEYKTGILNSGYHFVDDHEIFNYNAQFAKNGFLFTLKHTIISDLSIRFRPTYRLLRAFEALVLGTHFFIWHLFFMLQTIALFFFAYVFARKMSCSVGLSSLFVIILFLGRQSAAFWRLGPQEMIGMLLLMLNLLCLYRYAFHNTMKYTITSLILAALLGGTKESFLLLLPAFPVLLFFFVNKDNDYCASALSEKSRKCHVLHAILLLIKQRIFYVIGILFIFMIDIGVILLRVGLLSIGYAGIDTSMGIKEYVASMIAICQNRLNIYCQIMVLTIISLVVPLSIYIFVNMRSMFSKYLSVLLFHLFFFCYCLGTQLLLYAKSGMSERYLLPATFAFAFFLIIGLNQVFILTKINPLSGYVIAIILMVSILTNTNVQENAEFYVQDGKDTTSILSVIGENAQPDTKVLVSFKSELDTSTAIYLQEKFDVAHVYSINSSKDEPGMASDNYIKNEEEMKTIKCEDADIYMGFSDEIETFMTDIGLDINNFIPYTFGRYTVYITK